MCEAAGEVAGALGGEGSVLLEEVVEGAAGEEVHDEEGAALVLADVVDGDDGGVAEARGGAGFLEEAEGVFGVEEVCEGELEDDVALEGGVVGEVDDAHAAA